MKDQCVRTFPKCDCGGELVIDEEDFVFGFQHCTDAIIIYSECILCGQIKFQFFEIADFIDIERELLNSLNKQLPPGENNEN